MRRAVAQDVDGERQGRRVDPKPLDASGNLTDAAQAAQDGERERRRVVLLPVGRVADLLDVRRKFLALGLAETR